MNGSIGFLCSRVRPKGIQAIYTWGLVTLSEAICQERGLCLSRVLPYVGNHAIEALRNRPSHNGYGFVLFCFTGCCVNPVPEAHPSGGYGLPDGFRVVALTDFWMCSQRVGRLVAGVWRAAKAFRSCHGQERGLRERPQHSVYPQAWHLRHPSSLNSAAF